MSLQNLNKRPFATIDLTGDLDDNFTVAQRKHAKTNAKTRAAQPSNYLAPSSGSSSVGTGSYGYGSLPARSQASQFRYDEDGGNELVDDEDERYDDLNRYVLYGGYIAFPHFTH
jgi:hypothetical protein